jgi:hypothetical protein
VNSGTASEAGNHFFCEKEIICYNSTQGERGQSNCDLPLSGIGARLYAAGQSSGGSSTHNR